MGIAVSKPSKEIESEKMRKNPSTVPYSPKKEITKPKQIKNCYPNGIRKVPFNVVDKTYKSYESTFEIRKKVLKEMKEPPFEFKSNYNDVYKIKVPERPSTARLVLRVQPKFKTDVEMCPWVTIDYCCNRTNGTEILNVPEGFVLEGLLSEEDKRENTVRDVQKKTPVNIFFSSIVHIMNNFDGDIWWNGFRMKLIGPPSIRLELIAYQMEPLRLTFQLNTLQKIDIIRENNCLDLIGHPLTSGTPLRMFHIEGRHSPYIKIVNPKDGTLVLNFPHYSV